MIGQFFTSLGCLKVLGKTGPKGPKKGNIFEKLKKIPPSF